MPVLVGPTGGKHAVEATATFRVAEVRDNILSLGKLVREGFSFTLGPRVQGERRQERAALLGMKQFACGGSCVGACVETWTRSGGDSFTGERDERLDGMDVKESHSSSNSGPAVGTSS